MITEQKIIEILSNYANLDGSIEPTSYEDIAKVIMDKIKEEELKLLRGHIQ